MRVLAIAATALWAGLIFYLSSLPSPPGQTGGEWQSYAAHVFVYFVLAWLAAHAGRRNGLSRGRAALLAVLLAAGYGASDEYHQSFVPERDVSALDWACDLFGGGLAAAIWYLRAARQAGTSRSGAGTGTLSRH